MLVKHLITLASLLALSSALVAEKRQDTDVEFDPDAENVDPSLELPTPDIDAIWAANNTNFTSYQTGGLVRSILPASNSTEDGDTDDVADDTLGIMAAGCRKHPVHTHGDKNSGKGIVIHNSAKEQHTFFAYHNNCDKVPFKYITIPAGKTRFLSLPGSFQGRVTRGTKQWNLMGKARLLATWFEISYDAAGNGWGDVSLIRGCDGAVAMWSLDGSGAKKGFRTNILVGAPKNAYAKKADGKNVIKATEGHTGAVRPAPRNWDKKRLGVNKAYVDDHHGNPVIMSSNGRFGTWWAAGRP